MAYFDKYGVEYSDDRKTLVRCPIDFKGEYTIPNGVTSIEDWAFIGCYRMTSLTIPDSVTSIGDGVFPDCDGLTLPVYNAHIFAYMPASYSGAYNIPDGIETIANNAFSGCSGLTSIKIPSSVISIGSGAFSGCTGLTSIEIPNSVRSIGNGAFSFCKKLTSVAMSRSVIEIGDVAFDECKALTFIELPNSVTSMGSDPFLHCESLPVINGIRYANSYLVQAVDESLSTYTIKEGTKWIGDYAFYACDNLTSIKIPNSVSNIGDLAFCHCRNLASIEIPDSVISIGNYAFGHCTSLTSIRVPESVNSIGEEVFSDCDVLEEIFVPTGQKARFMQMGLKAYSAIIKEESNAVYMRIKEEQRRLQEQQMQEMMQGSILFFDTETTGTPQNYRAPVSDSYNWPRLVQLAWIMADKNGNVLKRKSVIIKPIGFTIPADAAAIHGITTERALREGQSLRDVLDEFCLDLSFAEKVVGHNIDFDQHIVGAELYRLDMDYSALMHKNSTCTMKSSTDFCAIPNPNSYYGGYKWPSLSELYRKLFGRSFDDAHDALADITATKDCYYELKRKGII